MVRQQFSPVCWLASAVMVMQFKQRRTLDTETVAASAGLQGPDFRTPGLTVASEYPTGPEQHRALTRLGFRGKRFANLAAFRRNARERENATEQATEQGRRHASAGRPRMRHSAPTSSASSSADVGEEVIFSLLEEHGPFLLLHNVGAFSYGANLRIPPQALGSGHVVVITGFFPGRHRVTFNNPWGQVNVPATSASILGAMRRWESRTTANKSIYWL